MKITEIKKIRNEREEMKDIKRQALNKKPQHLERLIPNKGFV